MSFPEILEVFVEAARGQRLSVVREGLTAVKPHARLREIYETDFPRLEREARTALAKTAAERALIGPRGPTKRTTAQERQEQKNAATRRWRAKNRKPRKAAAPKPPPKPRRVGRDPVRLAAYKERERIRKRLHMRRVRAGLDKHIKRC